MRKLRFLLSLLLLLVLPVQGYAMVRMALLGADCAMHAKQAQAPVEDGAAAMPPCHTMAGQTMGGMQAPSHDTPGDEHPVCVKCPLCAMNGSMPAAAAFALTVAPRHDGPQGLFIEPAAVYAEPPMRVPRGHAA